MRHPGIAAVGPVLDDDQLSSRTEHAAHQLEHRPLVADKMQRVRHHDAIEARKIQGAREVPDPGLDLDAWILLALEILQGSGITVDGGDVSARSEQVGQRERERPLPRSKVRPTSAAFGDPALDEAHQVGMIHLAWATASRTAGITSVANQRSASGSSIPPMT